MGIDITKLNDDEILDLLGDGNWYISVAEGIPAIVVTEDFRDKCLTVIAEMFVRWVKKRADYTLHGSREYAYLDKRKSSAFRLRDRHKTLEGWAKNEYTGQMSLGDMTIIYPKYETEILRHLFYVVNDFLSLIVYDVRRSNHELDYADVSEAYSDVEIHLVHALELLVYSQSTYDIWQDYESEVQLKIEDEALQREEHIIRQEERQDIAKNFWRIHFSDALAQKLDKSQFEALNIEARLRDILSKCEPETIKAIAEVSWTGTCWKNIKKKISSIAHDVLKQK